MNPNTHNKADGLALAGLVCGIIGCLTIYTGIPAIFFGALGLIFGLLARGNNISIMNKKTRAAVILGIVAIVGGVLMLAFTAYALIDTYGSLENAFNDFMKTYNESYDKLYDSLY